MNENPASVNFDQMDLAALRDLRSRVETEITQRQKQEVEAARQRIMQIAQSVGVPIDELLSDSKGGRKAKVPGTSKGTVAVKYQKPDDSSKQWTGRGREPQWVKDHIAGGGTRTDLEIGPAS